MARALRRQRVRDLLELVGRARVLRLRVVVEVDDAALVDDDVLEDRPEGAGRLVDLGLRLGGEADHLRVAAALEVEDAVVAPAVLVVADQRALGIGRERRLARAGEAEEDRDVAVVADVRRAVHREDALERQAVVHQREDRLLDLARVEGAADQHLLARRVEDDERAGARAVRRRDRPRARARAGRAPAARTRAAPPRVGSMNIVRAKSAWYGWFVTTRTAIRCFGSAPANASTT